MTNMVMTLARIGVDAFVILQSGANDTETAEMIFFE
ncbi:hypothetical protein ViNHUV68_33260 [Vibrio sp. NH-UV-68]